MNQLSNRIKNLSPSATIAMTQKARELRESGKDIISLSIGEPDFETPDFVRLAGIQAILDNYNSYTPVGGLPELKKAIQNKFKRDNNLDYAPNQIVVSTGAKQSIYNLIQCLVDEGDDVIVPVPFWVSYADIVKLSGGNVVAVETNLDNDYKITAEQLEKAITPKTKVILFSSPCNPSGSAYSSDELEALANVIEKNPELIVIADEIYEYIQFGEKSPSIASFQNIYNQCVIVNGLSKGYAMTGWRIGYMGGPDWLAAACQKLQGQVTSGTNAVAQRAAITALNADPTELNYMKEAFHKRRDLVLELASQVPGFEVNTPKGAFYIFPRVSQLFGKTFNGTTINSSKDLALYLLEEAGVATVQGDAFGLAEAIRISYAASEEQLREAFSRIKKALS